MVADALAFNRSVDDGHGFDACHQRLGDEGHVGQLDAMRLLKSRPLALADLHDARHINFEHRMHVRAGVFRFHHALGDLLAHWRHGHKFARDPRRHMRRSRRSCGPRRRGRRKHRTRCRSRCPGGCGSSALAIFFNEAEDVVLSDASAQSRAGDVAQADVVFPGDAAHQRAGTDALAFLRSVRRRE